MSDVVRVGVAVIVRRKDGKILIGLRKGSHGAGTWSVPGGHLELGETVLQCADREVIEETGLIGVYRLCELGRYVHTVMPAQDGGNTYVTLYVEGYYKGLVEPKVVEPDKCEEWRWVWPQSLSNPARHGWPGELFPPLKGYRDKYGEI